MDVDVDAYVDMNVYVYVDVYMYVDVDAAVDMNSKRKTTTAVVCCFSFFCVH